ncbi:MAG TPA: GTP 3',8-cyclase MoaA [Candidatus Polarisedimenticolia bacterium]|nr:GTP 3',8-cyclase MoaA [Candidatus Polarisedimenticolia bacterium]
MIRDSLARPLRDLRISVTDRCNFRCPYCMPAERYGASYTFLRRDEILTFEEIVRLARLFLRLGAEKIRLSGGEPLLREDLPVLVRSIAALPGVRDLAMTTNGQLLAPAARALKEAGLGRLTVSLDSLDPDVFRRLNGRDFGPERVLEGIAAAQGAGFGPLKINAVVVRGVNDASVVDLASRFRGTGHIVRFIEFMDVGNLNRWRMDQVVPAAEILDRIGSVFPLVPAQPSYPGEVARRYRYADGAGEIGIIASVTMPFCGGCTRARLSTDGRLFTCLFGTRGEDLKGPLRAGASDEELLGIARGVWSRRDDRYSEERSPDAKPASGPSGGDRRIEMYQIGG